MMSDPTPTGRGSATTGNSTLTRRDSPTMSYRPKPLARVSGHE
jgi:hypothetical protein